MKTPKKRRGFHVRSSIKAKTNLILSSVLLIVFTGLTILVYNSVHNRIELDTHENMLGQVYDIKTILKNHVNARAKEC